MSFFDSLDNLHESQRLEFKDARTGLPRDLWETYSAFANAEGGEIVLGISENKQQKTFSVVGVPDPDTLITEFWTTVRNPQRINRDIMLLDGVKSVKVDGKSLVLIDVPRAARGEKPVSVYLKGAFVAFVRRGESDLQATEDDLRLMGYDSIPSADRKPLEHFEKAALCPETINHYRNVFAGNKPQSPWNDDSTEDFLYHIGALGKGSDDELHPTVAGLLAFGYEYEITNYIPSFLLDYREETSGDLRWDDRIVSQSGDWSGNLIDFYFSVAGRIKRFFKMPFSTDGDGMNHGSRNPVSEAANEAVVNALIHAFYGSSSTAVRIIVKPEALEVSNPGSFLVDREVALSGGTSESRNPTLMRIFGFIGASDRAGSGLFNIWKTWQENFSLEPELEEDHSPATVKIVLPIPETIPCNRGNKTQGKFQRESGNVSEDEILAYLSAHPEGLTPAEAESELGITVRHAQYRLKRLFDKNKLTRAKDGRSFRYKIL